MVEETAAPFSFYVAEIASHRPLTRRFWRRSSEVDAGLALLGRMGMRGVWKFEDLIAWQVAVELQRVINGYCEKPSIRRDFKFRDQFVDAAASAPRNIAEGFGRFHHREFARFARIARASEQEVINHLLDAGRRDYINLDEYEAGVHVARRAIRVLNGLIRYLEETPNFGK